MLAATDYPLLDIFWSMILLFLWIGWFWILINCIRDIFRRHDLHGSGKALWLIVLIVAPFLGVLVYILVEGGHMAERNVKDIEVAQHQFDQYVRDVAGSGGSAAEIQRAHSLLQSGAISQAEFDQLKAKALSS